jgi:acetyl esterase
VVDVAALLVRLNAAFPPLGTEIVDAVEARAAFAALRRPVEVPTPVGDVRDESITGPDGQPLALRWYRPPAPDSDSAVLMFLHGGGFVLGDLDSHDELARKLAVGTGATVVSVDYRLAPEHPFPAGLDDAQAALEHVASSCAGGRPIVVVGESAGANLAATLCLTVRAGGGPQIAGQVLLYPMLDPGCDTLSYAENAEGYYITAHHLRWFWTQYVGAGAATTDPYVSPLRADDLRGLPPAHVVTAERDPLRDEGEAYARLLAEHGVPVTAQRYDDAFHGFVGFDAELAVAREAHQDIYRAIGDLTGARHG